MAASLKAGGPFEEGRLSRPSSSPWPGIRRAAWLCGVAHAAVRQGGPQLSVELPVMWLVILRYLGHWPRLLTPEGAVVPVALLLLLLLLLTGVPAFSDSIRKMELSLEISSL
ncbi:hypothetical protein EYF80_038148 [Liparis tanakae]|uniref:Uncharacterized protein n=1 Tax=Liparis tanakae TaxID=230148 RepID=A0A4Z2GG40_9TELE|nr:hypothetical protein EYF80_038148 [Liparis tanakae]